LFLAGITVKNSGLMVRFYRGNSTPGQMLNRIADLLIEHFSIGNNDNTIKEMDVLQLLEMPYLIAKHATNTLCSLFQTNISLKF
jgi:hypothetical protein